MCVLLCVWYVCSLKNCTSVIGSQMSEDASCDEILRHSLKIMESFAIVACQAVICSNDVTRWQARAEWPLTDAACNLHISVGVESANQSRAPTAAHAYHLHTAGVAPLSERGRGVEREGRKSKHEWCGRDRGWFVLYCAAFMPALAFRGVCRGWISVHNIPHLSFEGNEEKNHCDCCD